MYTRSSSKAAGAVRVELRRGAEPPRNDDATAAVDANVRRARDRERRWYRLTNITLLVMAVLYVLTSVMVRVKRRPDIFPLSSWALFSKVPNEQHDYTLRFTELDGKKLDPPVMFEQLTDRFPAARPSSMKMLLSSWAWALNHGDARTAASIRAYVERVHLRDRKHFVYELVWQRFDPLERWRHNRFREVRTLGTYRSLAYFSSPIRQRVPMPAAAELPALPAPHPDEGEARQ